MNIKQLQISNTISIVAIIFLSLFININAAASEKITAELVNKAIQEATTLRLKSQQLGFEWKMVKPYISQAKKANQRGNFAYALSLANQAIEYASLSITQAEHADKNWALAIPK